MRSTSHWASSARHPETRPAEEYHDDAPFVQFDQTDDQEAMADV